MSENALEKNPDLELAQKRFLLTVSDSVVSPAEKDDIKAELLAAIKEHQMLPFYKSLCEHFKWG